MSLHIMMVLSLMAGMFAVDIGARSDLIQVVIIGGNGDLAKKYLWQGFFNLFQERDKTVDFKFYGISRGKDTEESRKLLTILNNQLKCPQEHKTECTDEKSRFINQTTYFQNDYKAFGKKLDINAHNISGREIGRVFYLSLPPRAYLSVSALIHLHCRPKDDSSWIKLILEKPFGHNKETAQNMSQSLIREFSEDEIYRVDHYLGKAVVKQILPIRNLNRKTLEPILNRNHVDRVEISMLETVGVKGRMDFYDQYGVICDVLQNHMMEMLTLITMDLPSNISDRAQTKTNKLRLLKQIERIQGRSLLTGQYSSYLADGVEETGRLNFSSVTPTFAAALLEVNSPRWRGVPIVLVSGKKLKERVSYIKVVFKDNIFSTANMEPYKDEVGENNSGRQLVFHVEHGGMSAPGIVVSKTLGRLLMPESLKQEDILPPFIYEQPLESVLFYSLKNSRDAYSSVIADIVDGKHENFVGSDHLLALWDIWSDVLHVTSPPRLYDSANNYKELEFILVGSGLKFRELIQQNESTFPPDASINHPVEFTTRPSEFLGGKLFVNSIEIVIKTLSLDIQAQVLQAIEERGVAHIALSGGTTPQKLFQCLAQLGSAFPWAWTHIWLVDERCVSLYDQESNFHSLQENLLSFISIPYINIHPMPVVLGGRVCSPGDAADQLYADTIRHVIPGAQFDLVVLGMGTDGHTASLFPHQSSLRETQRLVVFSQAPGGDNPERLTLTYHILNSARTLNILVSGQHKHSVLDKLQTPTANLDFFPVLGIRPLQGNITWYIDDEAFYG